MLFLLWVYVLILLLTLLCYIFTSIFLFKRPEAQKKIDLFSLIWTINYFLFLNKRIYGFCFLFIPNMMNRTFLWPFIHWNLIHLFNFVSVCLCHPFIHAVAKTVQLPLTVQLFSDFRHLWQNQIFPYFTSYLYFTSKYFCVVV